MSKLDLSKLRFRIGDTVLYHGFECKVLAYYADEVYFGYTIDVHDICEYSHCGLLYSVDENGNSVDPKCDTCLYVSDIWLEPIKMETKEDHPLIKGLKEYLSKTSPEQFEKEWEEIQKRFGRFDGTSEEYEEYMRGCFDMKDIPNIYILENSLFPKYVKDKVSFIGKEITFFLNKQYNDAILLGFSVDNEDYYYRVDVNGTIGYIPLSIIIELKTK